MENQSINKVQEGQLSREAQELQNLLDKDNRRQRKQEILSSLDKKNDSIVVSDELPNVNEITSWMNNQTSVESQLEEQVHFYQNALEKLKIKSEEIANENAKLYEQMRQNVVDDNQSDIYERNVLHKKPKERLLRTKTESENSQRQDVSEAMNEMLTNDKTQQQQQKQQPYINDIVKVESYDDLNGVKRIYETKTKHLESLLRAAKKTIQEQEDEITKLKSEIEYFKTPVKEKHLDNEILNHDGIHKGIGKKVDRLTREKEELVDGIKRLKLQLDDGKRREQEAYNQVKKSCDLVQQAHLEKQEAIVLLKQTKGSLLECKKKNETLLDSLRNDNLTEISKLTAEFHEKINRLNSKIEDQTITTNKYEVQLEKVAREKVELKSELEKMRVNFTCQQAGTATAVEECRKELLDVLKSKALLEQDVEQIQNGSKQRDKRKQQEIENLTLELKETCRRLQIMENSLRQYQVDILEVTNKSNSFKLQLQTEKMQHNMVLQKYGDEKKSTQLEHDQRAQQLMLMVQESNRQYLNTKEELTKLLEVQTGIVKKYKDECEIIAASLFNEKQRNKTTCEQLSHRYEEVKSQLQKIVATHAQDEKLITMLEKESNNQRVIQKDLEEQVAILLNKQNSLLRDRHLLSKEIELLRNQSKTVTIS